MHRFYVQLIHNKMVHALCDSVDQFLRVWGIYAYSIVTKLQKNELKVLTRDVDGNITNGNMTVIYSNSVTLLF